MQILVKMMKGVFLKFVLDSWVDPGW
uniref:Uncharacterized protein n=1 Tax=Lepeophtheirus salmonis TaxID=72036 RepID=A0A0K2ULS9_LEPSM